MRLARWGKLDGVRVLVKAGADLDAEDENGLTAIDHATQRKRPEIIAYLLEQGARPSNEVPPPPGRIGGILLDEQGRPLMAELNKTVTAAQSSMANLDAAIGEARPGLQAFSKQTIPEVGLLVRDLREMSEALAAVAAKVDRGGASAIVGSPKLPTYKPKGN